MKDRNQETSAEATTEMLNIVEEMEAYATSLDDKYEPETYNAELSTELEGWAARMRKALSAEGPGKRRRGRAS